MKYINKLSLEELSSMLSKMNLYLENQNMNKDENDCCNYGWYNLDDKEYCLLKITKHLTYPFDLDEFIEKNKKKFPWFSKDRFLKEFVIVKIDDFYIKELSQKNYDYNYLCTMRKYLIDKFGQEYINDLNKELSKSKNKDSSLTM